jgi:hypothetical protein
LDSDIHALSGGQTTESIQNFFACYECIAIDSVNNIPCSNTGSIGTTAFDDVFD